MTRDDIVRGLDLLDEVQALVEEMGLCGEEMLEEYDPGYRGIDILRKRLKQQLAVIEARLRGTLWD